jgi:hypothetical protein
VVRDAFFLAHVFVGLSDDADQVAVPGREELAELACCPSMVGAAIDKNASAAVEGRLGRIVVAVLFTLGMGC